MTDQIMGVSMETVSFFSRYRTAHWTEALAIVIIAALLISNPILRRSRQPEDRMFRKLCYAGLFFSLICLLQVFTGKENIAAISWNSFAGHLIERGPDLINLLYTFMLLLFVDLAVYHSTGGTKRRYVFYIIPFAAVVVLWITEYIFKRNYVNYDEELIRLGYVYLATYVLTELIYLLQAFRVVITYQRDNKQPLFLRLDLIVIPEIFAFVMKVFFGLYLDCISIAVELLLLHMSMANRYRYLDFETGFYKESFIDFMKRHVQKKQYRGGCVADIRGKGDIMATAALLTDCKPERSVIFRMDDGDFLLLSSVDREAALKYFIQMIQEEALRRDPGNEIDVRYWLDNRDETTEEFVKRVLTERKEVS